MSALSEAYSEAWGQAPPEPSLIADPQLLHGRLCRVKSSKILWRDAWTYDLIQAQQACSVTSGNVVMAASVNVEGSASLREWFQRISSAKLTSV